MRLILQLCVLLTVLLGVENHAWGKVAAPENIAVRGFEVGEVFGDLADAPPALMSSGEASMWGYDVASDVRDGPNLYAYCVQNPWTTWDPEGLAVPRNRKEAESKIADFNSTMDAAAKTAAEGKVGTKEGRSAIAQTAKLLSAASYMAVELAVYQENADKDGNLKKLPRAPDPEMSFDADTTAMRRFSGLSDTQSIGLRDTTGDLATLASGASLARGLVGLIETGGAKLIGKFASQGEDLFWHGSAAGVARRNANGIFADGPGNGGLFWTTSKQMNELGPLAWKVGGNTNVRLIPPGLVNKGGLEATYKLTSAEGAMFRRAWGPDFNWNPYQWWKGAAGQYYHRAGAASWGQRIGELGKASGITGAGVGGGYLLSKMQE